MTRDWDSDTDTAEIVTAVRTNYDKANGLAEVSWRNGQEIARPDIKADVDVPKDTDGVL